VAVTPEVVMSPEVLSPAFPDEFVADPAVAYEQQSRYLDRCRRVRVGPAVTLVFENCRTLAFRVRELRILARRTSPARISRELDWYTGLLPGPGHLLATLAVREPGSRPSDRLNALARRVAAGCIEFRLGERVIAGELRPAAGGDRVLGPAYWVRFGFPADARCALTDPRELATVAVEAAGYSAVSEPLATDVRRSLAEDFAIPDES
jgi:hypothetical protein